MVPLSPELVADHGEEEPSSSEAPTRSASVVPGNGAMSCDVPVSGGLRTFAQRLLEGSGPIVRRSVGTLLVVAVAVGPVVVRRLHHEVGAVGPGSLVVFEDRESGA